MKKTILPTTIFYSIALFIFLFDQLTKIVVREKIAYGTSVSLIPNILYFTHTSNTGASFSILREYGFLLGIISAVVILGILFFYKKIEYTYRLPFALILGGTAGNLCDRIFFGHVTDFINVQIWPVFNVADSAISIAAILLLIIVWRE